MAKQKPTTYVASDGKEFKTNADADRHDAIVKAKDAYESARLELGKQLLANEKTADGQTVNVGPMTLYAVIGTGYNPTIQECYFRWNSWDWELDDDDRVKLSFRLGCGDKERWVTVRLDELYADDDNARQAVIRAWEAIIAEKQVRLDEMKSNPRTIRVDY